MRKKYYILLGLFLFLTFAGLIVCILKYNQKQMEEQKKREERWKIIKTVAEERKEKEVWFALNEEKAYREWKAIEIELEEKKAELIKICEENQEVFEQVSEELLNKLELDGKPREGVTRDSILDITEQMQSPEWEKLSGIFSMYSPYYPLNDGGPEGRIYYHYWSGGRYVLRVLYINVDEQKALEYLYCCFDACEGFEKINEHLYVCIEGDTME